MAANHVLKVSLTPGLFKSRLLEALESLDSAYKVVQGRTADVITVGLEAVNSTQPATAWKMNRYVRMFDAASESQKEQRLNAAGLLTSRSTPKASATQRFRRCYAVTVFHLQALAAVPVHSGAMSLPLSGGEVEPNLSNPLWRSLARMAVRALYAFGLDMGEVVIVAGEGGQFAVQQLSPEPEYGGTRSAQLIAAAMSQMLFELNNEHHHQQEGLIGMDPEFLLVNNSTGKVIPASRFLRRKGIAGCDVLRYRGRRMMPLAELRPEPGKEPDDCVRHLLRAFRVAKEAIPEHGMLWQAGGMPLRGFPLGGHLHFSGVTLTAELLRTLDNYLALPVALLEDGRSFRRRPLYGYLGDFRLQNYGGFEYRTLPSFLISPVVAKGVIALAKLISKEYRWLARHPLQDDKFYHAFYSGDQPSLRSIWPQLAADLQATPSYSRYESYIAPFLQGVQSGRTWNESADIRRLWKL